MIAGQPAVRFESGRVVGVGSYCCRSCGLSLEFEHIERLTRCPACGGTSFRRTRMFEGSPGTEDETLERLGLPPVSSPEWLSSARGELSQAGPHLAYSSCGQVEIAALRVGWSRIGRSAVSDIRLDDPTVSRRHALVVRTRDRELRVLDDRSLNGVRVNGEQVEWGTLADGDELAIGRFRLYVLEREPTGSGVSEPSPSAD